MGLGAIGAATGEGYTAGRASEAIARSAKNSGDIIKNMLVGQAISESASIFSLVIAILLLFLDASGSNPVKAASLLGAGLCMGFGGIGPGREEDGNQQGQEKPGHRYCVSERRESRAVIV